MNAHPWRLGMRGLRNSILGVICTLLSVVDWGPQGVHTTVLVVILPKPCAFLRRAVPMQYAAQPTSYPAHTRRAYHGQQGAGWYIPVQLPEGAATGVRIPITILSNEQ
mmetsp:Transcript_90091/g.155995  ORF Transcript_90091/g.155995 Transcript_90091/m.155995 type:complete len:108 (-) Transcript_90091:1168-1491(-)